jgi:hypothetical protein
VSEYAYNEVAIDYNAGFVGALAGLYDIYGRDAGHQSLPDFPPPEPDDVQAFWIDARVEQENIERTQVTVKIHGIPIHLPFPVIGVTCRYFFDISELVAVGQTIDNVFLDIYYDQMSSQFDGAVTAEGPLPWDETNNIYYVEFDWSNGGIIGARDLQFGLWVTQAPDWNSYWDPTNDYSREGITDEFADTKLIPVYHNGTLVYGEEPPVSGATATPTPTNPPDGTPTPTGPFILGDVDDSGIINIVDALLIARHYVQLEPENFNPDAADTDCNGNINIVDALLVARYYVNLITGFCL